MDKDKVDMVENWVENLLRFSKENGGYFETGDEEYFYPMNYYSYAIKETDVNNMFIVELMGRLQNEEGAEFGKLAITVIVKDLVHDVNYDFTPLDLNSMTGLFRL